MRIRQTILFLALMLSTSLWSQSYIETINIENQAVADYMLDAAQTYSNNPDYRLSVVTKYNNSDKYGKKLYWPRGKEVVWIPTTTADNIQEIRITVSENPDYRDSLTYHPDEKSANRFVIRNSLPNRTYYYKLEEFQKNGICTELANGAFHTIGQVRMIQVRNNSNIRDLGGWPSQYGKSVKYGRLYRSGSLERTTAEGRHDFVDNLGVTAELDLRHEVRRTKSCLGEDKDYLRLDHGMYMEGLTKRYHVYATDLRWIIDRLHEGKNVDWHCAIGCDRCGTLSFLIEGLLGMNEIDICRDYELSTFSLSSKNKRVRSPLKNMFNHIRKFGPPDNLSLCFYNYWLSIGMEREELDYFLSEMLDIPNIATMTREPEQEIINEDYSY